VVFLGFNIFAKNVIQKTPVFSINLRTTVQPTTYYTCPAGKVATVKGLVRCDDRGAAANATLEIAGINYCVWDNNLVKQPSTQGMGWDYSKFRPDNLTTQGGGQGCTVDFVLNAGEAVITKQNSGTNASFDVFLEITESPA